MQRHPANSGADKYYDLFDDWELIEASFLKQYGIRLRQDDEDMSWAEFCSLLSGLMHDTPLGVIVGIRSEHDPKIIAKFTKEQKRIRQEWLYRQAGECRKKGKPSEIWLAFQQAAKAAYSVK